MLIFSYLVFILILCFEDLYIYFFVSSFSNHAHGYVFSFGLFFSKMLNEISYRIISIQKYNCIFSSKNVK